MSRRILGKKLYRLADGHLQDIIYILSPVLHLKDIALETLAPASLTRDGDIGHELHLDGDFPFPLALLTSATFGIEREIGRCEAHLLGTLLCGKQCPYLIVCLEVCGRIGTRRFANRVLVDEFHSANPPHIPCKFLERAGRVRGKSQLAQQGSV